jgi:hypothetical protein
MIGSQGSFMDGLAAAAAENPLAAALIGGGALWLLIGSDKLKNAAGSVTSAAAPLADLGARAQRSAASTWEDWEDAYGSMRKRASRMQDEASRGINETVRNTRTAASDAMSGAAETVNERFRRRRSRRARHVRSGRTGIAAEGNLHAGAILAG